MNIDAKVFENGEVNHERSRAEVRQVTRARSWGNDVGNVVIEVELVTLKYEVIPLVPYIVENEHNGRCDNNRELRTPTSIDDVGNAVI